MTNIYYLFPKYKMNASIYSDEFVRSPPMLGAKVKKARMPISDLPGVDGNTLTVAPAKPKGRTKKVAMTPVEVISNEPRPDNSAVTKLNVKQFKPKRSLSEVQAEVSGAIAGRTAMKEAKAKSKKSVATVQAEVTAAIKARAPKSKVEAIREQIKERVAKDAPKSEYAKNFRESMKEAKDALKEEMKICSEARMTIKKMRESMKEAKEIHKEEMKKF
jgi:ATP-dependent Lon protease